MAYNNSLCNRSCTVLLCCCCVIMPCFKQMTCTDENRGIEELVQKNAKSTSCCDSVPFDDRQSITPSRCTDKCLGNSPFLSSPHSPPAFCVYLAFYDSFQHTFLLKYLFIYFMFVCFVFQERGSL